MSLMFIYCLLQNSILKYHNYQMNNKIKIKKKKNRKTLSSPKYKQNKFNIKMLSIGEVLVNFLTRLKIIRMQ